MKIYLDMCSLQRPLDIKTQLRVAVEAEAILNILALCEAAHAELLASDALVFETMQNTHPIRKQGISVKRDNGVSVLYPEELDSAKRSVTLQSTDRHGILG
jgi:hypothetical protein